MKNTSKLLERGWKRWQTEKLTTRERWEQIAGKGLDNLTKRNFDTRRASQSKGIRKLEKRERTVQKGLRRGFVNEGKFDKRRAKQSKRIRKVETGVNRLKGNTDFDFNERKRDWQSLETGANSSKGSRDFDQGEYLTKEEQIDRAHGASMVQKQKQAAR